MRGKLWFIGGLATGFVLGARAGREKYEELMVRGRKVLDHPTVQEAAGVAQAQANRLYTEGKDRLSQSRLGEKLGTGRNGQTAELPTGGTAYPGGTTGTSSTTSGSTTSGSTTSGSTAGGSTASGSGKTGASKTPSPAGSGKSAATGTNGTTV